MFKKIAQAAFIGTAVLAVPAAAIAGHSHYVDTPGKHVSDVGKGQTSNNDESSGGYHRFHNNVHLGKPGTDATTNEKNPVSIGKN